MKSWKILLVCSLVLVGSYIFLLPHQPSHDRDWYDFYAETPDATITDTTVTLHNVRNWNHDSTGVLSQEWLDTVPITITDIESVWFGLSRFGTSDLVGHSYLAFELTDGEVYMLSIEARREIDEQYGTFKGLFNQFELWYGWGTERDFLSASLFLLDRPLEYYKLALTPKEAQAVFVAMAHQTAAVAHTPQFYNTLSANCTNLLAKTINNQYPGRLPYHPAWNLPGRTLQYLYNNDLLDSQHTLEQHQQHANVTTHVPTLEAATSPTPAEFSRLLRELLQATE